MASRPLKSIGNGALRELTLTEEDYLAYRAGIHLGAISSSDASALTLDSTKTLIGAYVDTAYDGTGNEINTRTYDCGSADTFIQLLSDESHTVNWEASPLSNIPTNINVGDKLQDIHCVC